MKKSIGILGAGNVGEAVGLAFRAKGHDVCFYDVCREKAERHGYKDFEKLVADSEVIYECIPTESLPDGSCDLSILRSVIEQVAKVLSPRPRLCADEYLRSRNRQKDARIDPVPLRRQPQQSSTRHKIPRCGQSVENHLGSE